MLSKIQSALSGLLAPGEPLLVGVSGGPDSVALLDVLVKSGCRPHVCHLNHQLRGAESDADAEFVRALAGRYDLPATIDLISNLDVGAPFRARSPLPGRARKGAPTNVDRTSEDLARRVRFEFFESVAERTGISTLALAHTADDQVETFLLRLLRGAGAPGLVGMWPDRRIGQLRVIRPLLKVTRAEVLQYLCAEGLSYREDATNLDTRFTRNRIRHELIPLLEREFNPAIRDVLLRTAEILRDEDELLEKLAESILEGHPADAGSWPQLERTRRSASLQIKTLREQPVALQRRVLRRWLGEGLDFEHIEAVRQLSRGQQTTLPGGVVVCREGDALRIVEEEKPVHGRWPVAMNGKTKIPELGVILECADSSALSLRQNRQSGDKSPHSKEELLDADSIGAAPFVRTWEEGDRFQPLGMTGEKKLQDFFVDEKVPRRQRGRVPLLCAADGRIAWVVSYRIAEPFKVTERTRRILRVRAVSIQG
jgi:tRNA(Ile)-lysidine synthase